MSLLNVLSDYFQHDSIKRAVRPHAKKIVLFYLSTIYYINQTEDPSVPAAGNKKRYYGYSLKVFFNE